MAGNSQNKVFTSAAEAKNHNRWSEPGEFEKDLEQLDKLMEALKQRDKQRKEQKKMEREYKEREREFQRQMRERKKQEENQQREEEQRQRQERLNNAVSVAEFALKKITSLLQIPFVGCMQTSGLRRELQFVQGTEPN